MQLSRHADEDGHAGAGVIDAGFGHQLVDGGDEFFAGVRVLREGRSRRGEAEEGGGMMEQAAQRRAGESHAQSVRQRWRCGKRFRGRKTQRCSVVPPLGGSGRVTQNRLKPELQYKEPDATQQRSDL